MKHIVAFGTFDTKGNEYKFLKECMERQFDGENIARPPRAAATRRTIFTPPTGSAAWRS